MAFLLSSLKWSLNVLCFKVEIDNCFVLTYHYEVNIDCTV